MGFQTVPNPLNYRNGGIIISLTDGETTLDLGNLASFGMDPSKLNLLEHFSARLGQRQKDRVVIVQAALSFSAKIDEHVPDIYAIVFQGEVTGVSQNIVTPLTAPLKEWALTITYLDLAGDIWVFTADRCVVRPAGNMDFGDFASWSEMSVEIEVLKSLNGESNPYGEFTFAV